MDNELAAVGYPGLDFRQASEQIRRNYIVVGFVYQQQVKVGQALACDISDLERHQPSLGYGGFRGGGQRLIVAKISHCAGMGGNVEECGCTASKPGKMGDVDAVTACVIALTV